ncbi:MAG: ATP-dependent helicase [Rhodocyclaceae bacterium]
MARIIPDGWRELAVTGAAAREIATLHTLASSLPDTYTVFHNVHWSRLHEETLLIGEADFVVVAPSGHVLLIDQENGFLKEDAGGLLQHYDKSTTAIVTRLGQSAHTIQQRLRTPPVSQAAVVDILLYCPDYTIRNPSTVGVPPERIIDASRRGYLCAQIESITRGPESASAMEMVRFFSNRLQLMPDVRAFVNQAEQLYMRLSGGLAQWARQVECHPHRLHVVGTAGSGKTQLALAALHDAVAAGRRALYVCYNRPLADHVAHIAPPEATVATYHHLCSRIQRSQGIAPDYAVDGAFERVGAPFPADADLSAWQFDELIVDEGQDFEPPWFDNLMRLLRPEGRAWWLEDPMQKLYRRESVEPPNWVKIHSNTNYRTPADMLEQIADLLHLPDITHGGSPLRGAGMSVKTYEDDEQLSEATRRAVTECLGAGFRRDMIALITFKGRDKSALMQQERLGPNRLQKFTGEYDMLGSPVFSEGDLLIETVYRFKGQSCPCVILTEVDFDTLDEIARRKLFVGATRATQKLVIVMSGQASRLLTAANNTQAATP